jgi:hypothetical protein
MSEKLRLRLRKRGRGDSRDDEDICAYFNLTSDLLGNILARNGSMSK